MVDDTEAYDAARALSDVNAQLKMAVDLGKIAIWRHDLRTGRMYYSDRAFELLGLPPRPEGLSIDEVRSFIHPDDIPIVLASAKQALASTEPTDLEARYRRIDGTWRYVLSRRVVERNGAGEPIAFLGVALDMTERVEHLRHAEELARRLDAASRAAGVGIWTTTLGPGGADWNAQMFELFECCPPPNPPSFGQWLASSVHADDRERVGHQAKAYFLKGDGPFEMEFRALRRDGSVRWVVMRSDVDRVHTDRRRILGVAMDVTEHHRALEALREASQRAALITRHAGIGTWDSDAAGAEHWDAQMFQLRGLEPGEQAPSRVERLALVHPDDRGVVIDAAAGTPEAHLSSAYEFRVRLPDGSYRWLASRSADVLDEAGRPARRVGVNWDITESKNAEMARQQAAIAERGIQAKSQFLSRMSHELRTPLNAVLGFTQLLQIEARQSGQADQLAKLEHVRAAGDHLLSLINDVLDLSGLEAGEIKLLLQPVDLDVLVRQSLPLLQSLASQHDVVVERRRSEGIALADPTRLRQVLINLLSNAIKYNRRGGRVVVDTWSEGDQARLAVSDTGRGLTESQIVELFEPFNRFGVEQEGIEGTGIGLTIVKTLVDGMGGRIVVASEPGSGTTFEVTLPAAAALPARDAASAAASPATAAGERATRRDRRQAALHRGQPRQRPPRRGARQEPRRPDDRVGDDGARRRDACREPAARSRPRRHAAARLRRLRGAASPSRRAGDTRDPLRRLVGQRHARGHRARPGCRIRRLLDQADRFRRLHHGPAALLPDRRRAARGRRAGTASRRRLSGARRRARAGRAGAASARASDRDRERRGTPRQARSSCPTSR